MNQFASGSSQSPVSGKLFHARGTIVLCLSILALGLSAGAGQPTFATFDPPGSVTTYVEQINPSGTIIGIYLDAGNVFHAFRRDCKGKITSYDAPAAGKGPFQGTAFDSINPSGKSLVSTSMPTLSITCSC